MTYQKNYYPRRPVKSFQDLEVYQKLLSVAVAINKRITEDQKVKKNVNKTYDEPMTILITKLLETALGLPIKIATAHSLRFGDSPKGILLLEESMLSCNLAVVYLELYRDLYNQDIETEFFEEHIRSLLTTRFKVMHLQMSWKKFTKEGGNNA